MARVQSEFLQRKHYRGVQSIRKHSGRGSAGVLSEKRSRTDPATQALQFCKSVSISKRRPVTHGLPLPSRGSKVTAMEKPLDVVIKTRALDLVPFLQLQTDLAQHSRLHGCTLRHCFAPRARSVCGSGVEGQHSPMLGGSRGGRGIYRRISRHLVYTADHQDRRREHHPPPTLSYPGFKHADRLRFRRALLSFQCPVCVCGERVSRRSLGTPIAQFPSIAYPGRLAWFRAANQIFSKPNAQALMRYVEARLLQCRARPPQVLGRFKHKLD